MSRALASIGLCLCSGVACAVEPVTASGASGASGASAASAAPTLTTAAPAAAASSAAGAAADRRVIEDDGVRIEETRVRGQLSRVTVQSKLGGGSSYEIIVGPGGRDPSQKNAQGASGQRAWSVLKF